MWKLMDVDPEKWKMFKRHCAMKDSTMKAEMDKILDKFKGDDNEK